MTALPMRQILSALIISGSMLACAPVAPDAPGAVNEPGRCFLVSQVRNFKPGEERESIIVEVSNRAAYELTAIGYCRDIDWANRIAIQPFGGTSNVCVGDQVDLVVAALGSDGERCRVNVTRSLSPAEYEALD